MGTREESTKKRERNVIGSNSPLRNVYEKKKVKITKTVYVEGDA